MSYKTLQLEQAISASFDSGDSVVRLFTMNDQLGQNLTLDAEMDWDNFVATVSIKEHDCFLSTKAAPSTSYRDALHKLAVLLDSYLSFCYGEFYKVRGAREDET